MIRRIKPAYCYVDPRDRRRIIQYFRDLANVGHLLDEDVMVLASRFRQHLINFGWSREHVDEIECIAYSRTNWEEFLPRIRSKGSWFEYIKNRGRLK